MINKKLTPFKWCMLQTFPFIEATFDAIEEYDLLCKIVEYVNKNIDKTNTLGIKVEELNNWFNSLDVQDEINKKLDEMAENGQLSDIISQFLNTQAVIAFNNISEMKNADNISNGSICRTLGEIEYNDGKGSFYKIRTITNQDIIDNENIISLLNFENLIAEKIFDEQIKNIEDEIDNLKNPNKKMIVIGDSFSTNAQSGSPLWYEYISKWHNLEVFTTASDGQGYATGDNNFLKQLETAKNSNDINTIEEIYIVGGLNDLGNNNITKETFKNSVISTLEYAQNNFPNSKIFVIGILPFQFYNFYSGNNCFVDSLRAHDFQAQLSSVTTNIEFENIIFKNAEYLGLSQENYFGDANNYNQRHPSSVGEKIIANFIENNEKNFGYNKGISNYLINTPLECDNGVANIERFDGSQVGIKIENYNNNLELNVKLSGLPFTNSFIMVTDELGHTSAFYEYGGALRLGANTGLNSGTIYFSLPWILK